MNYFDWYESLNKKSSLDSAFGCNMNNLNMERAWNWIRKSQSEFWIWIWMLHIKHVVRRYCCCWQHFETVCILVDSSYFAKRGLLRTCIYTHTRNTNAYIDRFKWLSIHNVSWSLVTCFSRLELWHCLSYAWIWYSLFASLFCVRLCVCCVAIMPKYRRKSECDPVRMRFVNFIYWMSNGTGVKGTPNEPITNSQDYIHELYKSGG